MTLEVQDQLEARIDASHRLRRESPGPLGEMILIEGHDLRDVGDEVLGQTTLLRYSSQSSSSRNASPASAAASANARPCAASPWGPSSRNVCTL